MAELTGELPVNHCNRHSRRRRSATYRFYLPNLKASSRGERSDRDAFLLIRTRIFRWNHWLGTEGPRSRFSGSWSEIPLLSVDSNFETVLMV